MSVADGRGTAVVVLSGKGGTAKTLWQLILAGESSRAGKRTLLVDVDPERNLSNRFKVPQHATGSTGLGKVLEAMGVVTGEGNVDAAAKTLGEEICSTPWDGVELLPAGASLGGVSQVAIAETWMLRDVFETAGLYDRYDLIFMDTAGRTGSLVTLAMYAADVAYAPIGPTTDAILKAKQGKIRVERIQRAHPLRWAGVVLSGFDLRMGIEVAIRQEALAEFEHEVRAEVPRRAAVQEAFQLCERLGDRPDVTSCDLAKIFRSFLFNDLLGVNGSTAVGERQA